MEITLGNATRTLLLGCLMGGLILGRVWAGNYTYNYVGGATGYSGTIVLDTNASPAGGGSVSDIVAMSVTTPSYGTLVWSPADITTPLDQFTWDSAGITLMNIQYDIPPGFSFFAVVVAGAVYDRVEASGTNGLVQSFSGKWVAAVAPGVHLTINKSGTNVLVSWPTNSGGFQLQGYSGTATNAHWTAVTNPVSINSTNYRITLPVLRGSEFYRLQSTN
jgi:hypothetical protein